MFGQNACRRYRKNQSADQAALAFDIFRRWNPFVLMHRLGNQGRICKSEAFLATLQHRKQECASNSSASSTLPWPSTYSRVLGALIPTCEILRARFWQGFASLPGEINLRSQRHICLTPCHANLAAEEHRSICNG